MKAYIFDTIGGIYTIVCEFNEEILKATKLKFQGTNGEITLDENNIEIERRFSWGIPKSMRIYVREIDLEEALGELKEIQIAV